MSGFAADWLALREPADRRARTTELAATLARWLARCGHAPVRIVDLGCGSGANLRLLAPLLPVTQSWICIDDAPELLRIAASERRADVAVECRQLDLVSQLDEALRDDAQVITASALLDLVSAAWLEQMLTLATRKRAALLFALNYDGRASFAPEHAFDDRLRELFAAHQLRDKGFGPALGPQASAALDAQLTAAGYWLLRKKSDWRLDAGDPADAALIAPLLQGMVAAACEQCPEAIAELTAWLRSRRAAMIAGALRVTIGHDDVLALPAASSAAQ